MVFNVSLRLQAIAYYYYFWNKNIQVLLVVNPLISCMTKIEFLLTIYLYNTKQASDENKEKYQLSGLLKIIIQMMFLIC